MAGFVARFLQVPGGREYLARVPGVATAALSDADLAEAITLIGKHDAVGATRERARHFAQRAIDALAIFPASKAREAMVEAAQFAVSRGY